MGIARGRRRGRKFVNFAITAVLAFNRRGFVVRKGIVIVVVARGRREGVCNELGGGWSGRGHLDVGTRLKGETMKGNGLGGV